MKVCASLSRPMASEKWDNRDRAPFEAGNTQVSPHVALSQSRSQTGAPSQKSGTDTGTPFGASLCSSRNPRTSRTEVNTHD